MSLMITTITVWGFIVKRAIKQLGETGDKA